jgi:hypothetical protein
MTWNLLDASAGLWAAPYKVPNFPCRSTAVPLADGSFAVHSPGGGIEDAFTTEVGVAGALVAGNSFHHMGIAAWRRRFPDATVHAAQSAIKRLAKQGHAGVLGLDALRARLPAHVQILEPPGVRVGEVWLRVEVAGGVAWVVCDAFFNFATLAPKAPMRLFQKLTHAAPGLSISALMKFGGLSDRGTYKAWALDQLARDRPTLLVPNHGEILRGPEVAARLRGVLEARL